MTTVAQYVPEKEKSVAQLIKDFEWDIENDPHGFTARYGRSLAKRELVLRGAAILSEINQHLSENPPSDQYKLDAAWRFLQEEINQAQ